MFLGLILVAVCLDIQTKTNNQTNPNVCDCAVCDEWEPEDWRGGNFCGEGEQDDEAFAGLCVQG